MSNKDIDTELNLFPGRQKMFFAALNTGFGKKKKVLLAVSCRASTHG